MKLIQQIQDFAVPIQQLGNVKHILESLVPIYIKGFRYRSKTEVSVDFG